MPLSEEYIKKQFETTEDRVDTLCASLEKQTKSINALIGTFATALVGFFIYAVEVGVFK